MGRTDKKTTDDQVGLDEGTKPHIFFLQMMLIVGQLFSVTEVKKGSSCDESCDGWRANAMLEGRAVRHINVWSTRASGLLEARVSTSAVGK